MSHDYNGSLQVQFLAMSNCLNTLYRMKHLIHYPEKMYRAFARHQLDLVALLLVSNVLDWLRRSEPCQTDLWTKALGCVHRFTRIMAHYKTVPMISSSINETRQDALQVTQLNVVEVLHCVPYVQVALISFSPSDVLHHDHHPKARMAP